jgi:LacI family transcriptional regulator
MQKIAKRGATIVDIARKLGLSAMTVSRALNGNGEVSTKTRERVIACAAALGYHPNRWARSLVTRKSLIVGVVIPDIAHSFFTEIVTGIEEVIEKAGYDILLCHSRSDPARERAEIEMLTGSRADGLIVAPVQPEDQPEPFEELRRREVPFVLVDRFFAGEEFYRVGVDDRAAGRLATSYLLDLGHRSVAHIAGPSISTGSLRRRGYLDALRAAGVASRKDWIVAADFDIEGGREAMHRLLKAGTPPTAVFAANDPMAIGAVYACREAGLRVPEDVSIVGAGNIEGPHHPNPFLTTIEWPRVEQGRVAAELLLAAIADPKAAPAQKVFTPELLERQSTASVRSAAQVR